MGKLEEWVSNHWLKPLYSEMTLAEKRIYVMVSQQGDIDERQVASLYSKAFTPMSGMGARANLSSLTSAGLLKVERGRFSAVAPKGERLELNTKTGRYCLEPTLGGLQVAMSMLKKKALFKEVLAL